MFSLCFIVFQSSFSSVGVLSSHCPDASVAVFAIAIAYLLVFVYLSFFLDLTPQMFTAKGDGMAVAVV